MARSPDPQLAQRWRARLDRFEQSQLTVADFCELEGYSTTSFYQWRRKLRDADQPDAPVFVPVDLPSSNLSYGLQHRIEIDLPGGAVVKLPTDASTAQQRELIATIIQATTTEVDS